MPKPKRPAAAEDAAAGAGGEGAAGESAPKRARDAEEGEDVVEEEEEEDAGLPADKSCPDWHKPFDALTWAPPVALADLPFRIDAGNSRLMRNVFKLSSVDYSQVMRRAGLVVPSRLHFNSQVVPTAQVYDAVKVEWLRNASVARRAFNQRMMRLENLLLSHVERINLKSVMDSPLGKVGRPLILGDFGEVRVAPPKKPEFDVLEDVIATYAINTLLPAKFHRPSLVRCLARANVFAPPSGQLTPTRRAWRALYQLVEHQSNLKMFSSFPLLTHTIKCMLSTKDFKAYADAFSGFGGVVKGSFFFFSAKQKDEASEALLAAVRQDQRVGKNYDVKELLVEPLNVGFRRIVDRAVHYPTSQLLGKMGAIDKCVYLLKSTEESRKKDLTERCKALGLRFDMSKRVKKFVTGESGMSLDEMVEVLRIDAHVQNTHKESTRQNPVMTTWFSANRGGSAIEAALIAKVKVKQGVERTWSQAATEVMREVTEFKPSPPNPQMHGFFF